MISAQEIEEYAKQIGQVDFDLVRDGEKLIGHLYGDDLLAVLVRASEIAREIAVAAKAEADRLEAEANNSFEFDLSAKDLGLAEFEAVIDRAEAVSRARGKAAYAAADTLAALIRLAHAAGCPSGVAVIPWLQERGLVEEVDGGFLFRTAKPGGAT
jgi:hypothetical protein